MLGLKVSDMHFTFPAKYPKKWFGVKELQLIILNQLKGKEYQTYQICKIGPYSDTMHLNVSWSCSVSGYFMVLLCDPQLIQQLEVIYSVSLSS